ncbi:MAG: transcription-repair coupling factor [Planctomycetota bacterium]|jgi:transcription-repair coupling factor (superfamily II helicase)
MLPEDRPSLVLHSDAASESDLAGDLTLFGLPRERRLPFPDLDDDERGLERLAVLQRLRQGGAPVVLASLLAATQPVPLLAALERDAIRLVRGSDEWGPEQLAERLAEDTWERVSLVTAPGEFSVRGDIVDLFPPGRDRPVRLEYFGDELETLREFDAATQRGADTIERLDLSTRGSEEEFGTLLDHFRLEDPVFLVAPDDEMCALVGERAGADLDAMRSGARPFEVRQVEPISAGSDQLRDRIAEVCADTPHAYFACRNEAEEHRVQHLLGDAIPAGLRFVRGRLSRSFAVAERGVAVLGYDDLLQHLTRRRPAPRRPAGRALDDFLDLEPGDIVVHLAHGIGRFRGVRTIERHGIEQEHCVVEFADDVSVYVPVSKIDLIQKYVGSPGGRARLAKLGGKSWAKAKERVKKAVTDLAARLLEVQAIRRRRPGIAHAPDDAMQHEFEATFPYEETPDQLSAIEAVKADMERPRPMDRLLCGDVGYGKTEVAMRAAFKAVVNGRQVAVLVPTTVLASQHFRTFTERMAGYPVRVEMLSRFRTAKEANAIIEQLAEGQVDIVIGTHRLLGKHVRFSDLGLVVIDEEQRFGVEHKERFKSMRATVDVLTMTATPIPRTLNLAMLGLRDISNLTTPPEGRMPVKTEVHHFDDKLVRAFIERELRRGGQVYFVHNRVETIQRLDRLVAHLVPAARRAVVHGQMNKRSLEESMLAFVRAEVDVLIATTIIESGLDIPNANTLIVDRADMIGLADLHQLRGRVGRGNHRAHALFLLPKGERVVTEVAEKRLRTIEEHSGLGAGFRIALKDLEIRGAGNILGSEQSGYIADVGYELYCRLLENAVREIREERVTQATDTFVDLEVGARFPDGYGGDTALRLGFYRRVAAASTLDELDSVATEVADRCGPLADEAALLFDVARLRILGQNEGIARFSLETGGVIQMGLFDEQRAVRFLRGKLGRSLRLPKEGLAVIAEPASPPKPRRALEVLLERLA